MRRAVVTGAAGFLGSHLCDALIAEGYQVVGLDNFTTGRLSNVEHLNTCGEFRLFDANVAMLAGEPRLYRELEEWTPTHIFHLASIASPKAYVKRKVDTLWVGSEGTHNMLDLAHECDARFVLASTSEVYGDPHVHPQDEEYWGNVNPIGPRSCYDESKRYAEALTKAFTEEMDVNAGILRLFNTYGPRMNPNDGRVVPTFIKQALRGEALTLENGGQQTRSLCYVSDTIEAFLRMAESDHIGPINIGNPQEFTMEELADVICMLTGSDLPRVYTDGVGDDPKRRKPDIRRAKELLDWAPTVTLAGGLSRTIAQFRECVEVIVA